METEEWGRVTIVMEGVWERFKFCNRLLFTGNADFELPRENFSEQGFPDGNTTCVHRATPEELMAPQTPRMAKAASDWRACQNASRHDDDLVQMDLRVMRFADQIGHGD